MEISLDTGHGKYQIRSYESGKVVINDKTYRQSLIVTPSELIYPWGPSSLAELTSEQIEIIAEKQPEVVILGTGETLVFPAAKILAPLINKNIGVEAMNNAAACRTFNVLMSEERKVILALIIEK